MSDPFVGQISLFGFNYAPYQWAFCRGQLLPISQNTALFSLLGTNYGGNGVQNFALPNLQGRMPLGFGTGSTGTLYDIGTALGAESVTLGLNQMPPHNHSATFAPTGLTATTVLNASTNTTGGALAPVAQATLCATSGGPSSAAIYAPPPAPTNDIVPLGNISTTLSGNGTVTVGLNGGGLPTPIMSPYLALNFSIALYGMFPSRN